MTTDLLDLPPTVNGETEQRRWYTIAVTKNPDHDRGRVRALLDDGRAFYDCIGADTVNDDAQFPLGAHCLYALQLTAGEAANLAQNGESTGEGNNVRSVDLNFAADPHTAPAGIPTDSTLRYLRADATSIDTTVWHGRDVLVAVLGQGTTKAVRDLMGYTLVGRQNVGDPTPTGQELHNATDGRASGLLDHECGTTPCAVPPGGRLLDVLAVTSDGKSSAALFAAGVRWAVDQGARIINYSYGLIGGETQAYVDALNYALNAGAEVFASTGNETQNALAAPSSYSRSFVNVHSVGAFDEATNARVPFSNYATDASGQAPGRGVVTLTPTATTKVVDGTSYAAPYATSACARGASGARFTPRQVGAALKANLRDTGQRQLEQGGGAYDLRRALVALGVAPAPGPRRNPSYRPSAELDASQHAVAGSSTPGAPTWQASGGRVGSGWVSSTAGAAGTHQLLGPSFYANPGQSHCPSVFFRRSRADGAAARIYVQWFDAANASLGYSAASPPAIPNPGANIWHRLSHIGAVAPANALYGRPSAFITDAVAGELVGVDGWLPEPAMVGVEPYFDGSYPGALWVGTPHASPSTLLSTSAPPRPGAMLLGA